MGTIKPQSNRPLYSNTVIGTLAADGWDDSIPVQKRTVCGAGKSIIHMLLWGIKWLQVVFSSLV